MLPVKTEVGPMVPVVFLRQKDERHSWVWEQTELPKQGGATGEKACPVAAVVGDRHWFVWGKPHRKGPGERARPRMGFWGKRGLPRRSPEAHRRDQPQML